ncbi:MAG: hypothetical protein WCR52_11850 [Bacteroidota bacterium]
MEEQQAHNPVEHTDNTTPGPITKVTQMSSNSTLFWRVFIPIFGTVLLSGLMLGFFLSEEDEAHGALLPLMVVRVLMIVIMLFWFWVIKRSFLPIKRIDADDQYLFVTNYWTTVRYPWSEVERIEMKKQFGRPLYVLCLKAPGRFGQAIQFKPSVHLKTWMGEQGKNYLLVNPAKA